MRLKGIHIVRSKGREYHYAYRGGPRLQGKPGSLEYIQSYADVHRHAPPTTSTLFASLVGQYKASPDFGGSSQKWRREKSRFLDILLDEFGEDDITLFEDARTRADIIELRDRMRNTPRKADHVIGELSAFLSWCQNRDRLDTFAGMGVDVRRMALNMDQVDEHRPPPNPAKLTDTRASDYIARYGRQSWELDALEPRVISDLVENEIMSIIDEDIWGEIDNQQAEQREALAQLGARWDEVREFLRT